MVFTFVAVWVRHSNIEKTLVRTFWGRTCDSVEVLAGPAHSGELVDVAEPEIDAVRLETVSTVDARWLYLIYFPRDNFLLNYSICICAKAGR